MSYELSQALHRAAENEAVHLRAISEEAASAPVAHPGGWTRKQELGHLLDSAANNHIRFVRAGLGPEFRGPSYVQNDWVALHRYLDLPWTTLVEFWQGYNMLLAHLVQNLPEESLSNACIIGDAGPVPLGSVIEDYIGHMQHHLDHILARPEITPFPRR